MATSLFQVAFPTVDVTFQPIHNKRFQKDRKCSMIIVKADLTLGQKYAVEESKIKAIISANDFYMMENMCWIFQLCDN